MIDTYTSPERWLADARAASAYAGSNDLEWRKQRLARHGAAARSGPPPVARPAPVAVVHDAGLPPPWRDARPNAATFGSALGRAYAGDPLAACRDLGYPVGVAARAVLAAQMEMDVNGITSFPAGRPPTITVCSDLVGRQQRQTLAHELAHAIAHDEEDRAPESWCDAFAHAFIAHAKPATYVEIDGGAYLRLASGDLLPYYGEPTYR